MSDDDWHRTRANLNPEDPRSPLYNVPAMRLSGFEPPHAPVLRQHGNSPPWLVLAAVVGMCLGALYFAGERSLVVELAIGVVTVSLLGLWAWRRFRRSP